MAPREWSVLRTTRSRVPCNRSFECFAMVSPSQLWIGEVTPLAGLVSRRRIMRAEASVARIALLGTGLLGSGMVKHFLKSGTQVTVWNRTEAKARELEPLGAGVATSPAAAVDGADRIHIVLPDDAAVGAVVEQLAPGLKKGAIIVDH